jgi:hypothetical protein
MNAEGGVASQHRLLVPSEPNRDVVPVKTLTLTELLDQEAITEVDTIKLNIHGTEYDVLMSTPPEKLRTIRSIVVQHHVVAEDRQVSKRELFEYLESVGFVLQWDHAAGRGAGCALLVRTPSTT